MSAEHYRCLQCLQCFTDVCNVHSAVQMSVMSKYMSAISTMSSGTTSTYTITSFKSHSTFLGKYLRFGNHCPIIDTQQTNFGDTSLTSAHINQGRAYRFHPVFNEDDVLVSCLMNIGFMVETKRYTRMSFITI